MPFAPGQRQEHQPAEREADPVERQRPSVIDDQPLGHETGAPDQGGEQQVDVGGEGSALHRFVVAVGLERPQAVRGFTGESK